MKVLTTWFNDMPRYQTGTELKLHDTIKYIQPERAVNEQLF